jgi:ethanolamine-phosphate cytidylyltransferase
MTGEERAKIVEACKWVDGVLPDLPYHMSVEILDKHGIDFILHGDDIIYNEQGESIYTPFDKLGRFK